MGRWLISGAFVVCSWVSGSVGSLYTAREFSGAKARDVFLGDFHNTGGCEDRALRPSVCTRRLEEERERGHSLVTQVAVTL